MHAGREDAIIAQAIANNALRSAIHHQPTANHMINPMQIMILGAGVYQVPLIRKAKEMGLRTIVVSPLGKYPGISLADLHLDIDTTDADWIVDAAKRYSIGGIVTTGTDVCLPSLGKVVDALGLPGTGFEAARRSMDKVLMKQALMADKVPTAAFRMFNKIEAAREFASHLGYPVMVKAPDSSGSRGITKVNNDSEFKFAWNRAYDVSRSKQIIVEQFLNGIEFGAQAFVHGDQVVAVFPHGDTVTPAPYFSPIGHSMPTGLTEEQQTRTAAVIEQAVRSVGICDCVSNVDLMLVDGEPKMIEIGARMGATCLPESISIYAGFDAYEHMIRLSLGEHPEIKVTAGQANACLLLRSNKTGIVSSLDVPSWIVEHPNLIEFQWDVGVGEPVRAFTIGPDRIGHIVVKSNTASDAERLVERMVSEILVGVDER